MITITGKYSTRDGRAVRLLVMDRKCSGWPIVGLIRDDSCGESIGQWRADGRYLLEIDGISSSDLVPVPTKHEGWVPLLTAGNSDVPRIDGVVNAGKAEIENFCERYHAYTLAHVTWED